MDATMVGSAALLLALIDDCEQVSWSYPGESELVEGSVGVDYINETYATDVKAPVRTKKRLMRSASNSSLTKPRQLKRLKNKMKRGTVHT